MATRTTESAPAARFTSGALRPRRHLVLVGGGHSHVQVLHRFAMRPEPDLRLTLVSPLAHATYSGMVPGVLVGAYEPGQGAIDVAALAARAGASFYADTVVRVDTERRVVEASRRGEIPYDLLSLDVGSRPRGIESVRTHPEVVGVKPVEEAATRIERFLEERRDGKAARVVVIGAGSGGIEVAFALRRQLARPGGQVTIVEAAPELLPAGSPRLRRLIAGLVERYGIEALPGRRFVALEDGRVRLDDGTERPVDLLVWATGAEGLPFLRASGLPVDDLGFVLVDDSLRCTSAEEVFAVGDCARMVSHPDLPRAGVFAVRQGPILEENLRQVLHGRPLVAYRPQRNFLSLLSTGDGRAVMSYHGLAAHGRVWWRLKDWIDRRFIARYACPAAASLRRGPEVAATMPMQACGGCAAKVEPGILARILGHLGPSAAAGVLVGLEAADDAAVLSPPPEGNLVFTVDAFPPFLSDPLLVGEVAALNALSDVYAMGGRPTAALALAGVAAADGRSREADLRQLMLGARTALDRLGVPLAGGHSLETEAPLIGFAVIGAVAADRTMIKGAVEEGDLLVLTKPLGTGVVMAATRAGECPAAWTSAAVSMMLQANDAAADALGRAGIRGCTDVSGFGLAGHLAEMLHASGLAADLWVDALPALPGAIELLAHDWRSSADQALRAANAHLVTPVDVAADDPRVALLHDPQTSGGLLAAVPTDAWPRLSEELRAAGVSAVAVGGARSGPPGTIRLRPSGVVAPGSSALDVRHAQ